MTVISFFILTSGLIAAFKLGHAIGKRSRRAATVGSVCCAVLIVSKAYFHHHPEVEFDLIPFAGYAHVQAWWPFFFALLLFGSGIAQTPRRREKIALALLSGILFLSVIYKGWATVRDVDRLMALTNQQNVILQSTKFCCGAAAAATLLTRIGIDTDEREMARLAGTNHVTGTEEIAVALGLRRKLAGSGRRAMIIRADWDEIRRLNGPAMANIRLSFLQDHWVVILDTTPDTVTIADPSTGIQSMSRNRFLAQWLGMLVFVEQVNGKAL
jgi:predicted double-glycine peptidase